MINIDQDNFAKGDKNIKPFTFIAVIVFSIVSVAHLIRLIFGWEITINGIIVPLWISVVGFLVAGVLALMLWRESHK